METKEKVLLSIVIIILLCMVAISLVSFVPIPSVDAFENSENPCGQFTKISGRLCVPDDEVIIRYLIDNNFIVGSKMNDRVVWNINTKTVPLEGWQVVWNNMYGSGCDRVPSKTSNPLDSWTPELTYRDRTTTIPYLMSSDQTVCAPGYCYVNGICVSPYKEGSSCCPECINVSAKDGGCAGLLYCDGTNCREKTTVEYPGTVVVCGFAPTMAPACEVGKNTGECWTSSHVNPQRRKPYVIFNNTCSYKTLCDLKNGRNEFDCALECVEYKDDLAKTQRECSKKCLPKIWKWYAVLKDGMPVGFWQSDDVFENNAEIMYCKGRGCMYRRDLGRDPKATNCEGCNLCNSTMDAINNNVYGFATGCKNCDNCKINTIPLDTGDCSGRSQEIVCDNLNTCTSCSKTTFNLFSEGGDYTCNQCSIPSDSCGFYTKNPWNDDYTLRSDTVPYSQK